MAENKICLDFLSPGSLTAPGIALDYKKQGTKARTRCPSRVLFLACVGNITGHRLYYSLTSMQRTPALYIHFHFLIAHQTCILQLSTQLSSQCLSTLVP